MMPHEIANPSYVPGLSPPVLPAQPVHSVPVVGAPVDEETQLGAELCARQNFEWVEGGLAVWHKDANGQPVRVFFPLHRVDATFQRETARVGCPIGPTVGDFSVGGFFKKIGRGLKKFKRKMLRPAKKLLSKSKFGRGIMRAANKIDRVARKVTRGVTKAVGKVARSKAFRGIMAGAAMAFPAIAPGVAALEAANQIADRVDKAKRTAKGVSKAFGGRRRRRRRGRRGRRRIGAPDAETQLIAEQMAELGERAANGDRDAMEMIGAWNTVAAQRRAN